MYDFSRIPLCSHLLLSYADFLRKNCPSVRIFKIGESVMGCPLLVFAVGRGEPSCLFVGTHHAAESITGNLLLQFLNDLLFSKKAVPDFTDILQNSTLYLLPLLNPDGVDLRLFPKQAAKNRYKTVLSMNGGSDDFTKWQANIRGVDLNHNYDAAFPECKKAEQKLGIIAGNPTRYGGPFPESEPESHALSAFTRAKRKHLTVILALHTQGEEIYWDFKGKAPEGAKRLADRLQAVSGYTLCSPPAEASFGGYKDYAIDKLGIPSFTVECGKGINPLPLADFDGIYGKILPIFREAAAFS